MARGFTGSGCPAPVPGPGRDGCGFDL